MAWTHTPAGASWGTLYDRRMRSEVSAFVLAGGKSTRMGTDKAFLMLDGRTLLSRMLEIARSVSANVRVVGERAKYEAFAPVVEDIFPGCGPLAGIHAALRSSTTDLNVILAVDIPFVPVVLLDYLLTRAANSASIVTVPRGAGRLQPLCAIYRVAFAEVGEKSLLAGHTKIDLLFNETSTQIVSEEELQTAGFASSSFRNLNTIDDLATARDASSRSDS